MIKNLVMSSGGVGGLSFIGALKKLQEEEYLKINEIECFCGVSIGSLISLLLIIGFSIEECIELGTKIDFKDFVSINAEDALSFFNNYGFDKGERMNYVLELFLSKKNFKKDITLKELYTLTKKKLIIVAVCLETREPVYFDYITYPDYPVVKCIRASVAIPFLYQPVKINNQTYVDGGVIKSFPIELFKKEKETTFGLDIGTRDRYYLNDTGNIPDILNNFKEYIFHIFYLPSCYSYKIPKGMKYIQIDIPGDCLQIYNALEIRKLYIKCGYSKAEEYLKNLSNK